MANFFQNKVDFELPKEQKIAVRELLKRGTESPDFPDRQVAGADPMQDLAYRLVGDYGRSGPSDAYTTALDQATRTATQDLDVTRLPEYQAVVSQIADYGGRQANRLQRGNIKSGNVSWQSSAGRDLLGRSVGETQQQMMAAAVPFLNQLRQERQGAINQLAALDVQGQGTALSKIDATSRVGEIMRAIHSAQLEAKYLNTMDPINFRYQTQPQMFSGVLQAPYTANVEPSEYQKHMLVAGTIGGMGQMMMGGG